jgi:hypothetical protein
MTDIFAEVDNALRQEKMAKLWQDYGKYFITFIVSVIAFTAIISAHGSWNNAVQKKQTEQLLQTLESADFPENVSVENTNLRPNLEAILFLQAAQRYYENGEIETAQNLYQAAIDSKAEYYSDMARLALSKITTGSSPEETLTPILKKKNNIWQPHALIQLALYKANNEQNYAAAIDLLKQVDDSKVAPPSVREKAKALVHVYTIQLPEKEKEG